MGFSSANNEELKRYASGQLRKSGGNTASTNATTAWNGAESARRDAVIAQGAAESAREAVVGIKNSLETEVKAYIDTRFGDVTAVFDSIHEYAESVIGGDAQ